ncbi:MAG TPA: hypothetical protein VL860_07550 [Planctomycetota bacterium]|nr:hypothetical protein [Planctomycetota bacterium]
MKARELMKMIEEAGAVHVRTAGGHRIYQFPGGVVLGISVGGVQNEVSDGQLAKVRRALKTIKRKRDRDA